MLRMRHCLLSAWLVVLAASPALAQSNPGGASLPSPRDLARFNLERAWWNQATLDFRRDKVQFLTADEESLYVQSTAGTITAFDSETGKRRWAIQAGRKDSTSYPLTTNNDYALVTAGTRLFALDKLRGTIIWQMKLPSLPSTSPAADAARIYIGTGDGSVYAISLRKVKELYEANQLPQYSGEAIAWRYKTAKTVLVPPVPGIRRNGTAAFLGEDEYEDEEAPVNGSLEAENQDARTVAFASRDKSLYSVIAEDRNLNWQFETDAAISAPLASANGLIFLASEDLNCYCIDSNTGQVYWEFIAGRPIRTAPRVIGQELFLAPDRAGLYLLSASNGNRLKHWPNLTRFLGATQNFFFASDAHENIVVMSNKADQQRTILGALPLRRFSNRIANDRTDRLFVATDDGLVVSIRERGSDFPIYHMFPDRRPILPNLASDGDAYESDEPPSDAPKSDDAPQPDDADDDEPKADE